MKEILKRWCESNTLSMEDASSLISEYLSYDGRTIDGMQLQAVLTIGQMIEPIAWDRICNTVAEHNGYHIVRVETVPDQMGHKRLICRKFYEE